LPAERITEQRAVKKHQPANKIENIVLLYCETRDGCGTNCGDLARHVVFVGSTTFHQLDLWCDVLSSALIRFRWAFCFCVVRSLMCFVVLSRWFFCVN